MKNVRSGSMLGVIVLGLTLGTVIDGAGAPAVHAADTCETSTYSNGKPRKGMTADGRCVEYDLLGNEIAEFDVPYAAAGSGIAAADAGPDLDQIKSTLVFVAEINALSRNWNVAARVGLDDSGIAYAVQSVVTNSTTDLEQIDRGVGIEYRTTVEMTVTMTRDGGLTSVVVPVRFVVANSPLDEYAGVQRIEFNTSGIIPPGQPVNGFWTLPYTYTQPTLDRSQIDLAWHWTETRDGATYEHTRVGYVSEDFWPSYNKETVYADTVTVRQGSDITDRFVESHHYVYDWGRVTNVHEVRNENGSLRSREVRNAAGQLTQRDVYGLNASAAGVDENALGTQMSYNIFTRYDGAGHKTFESVQDQGEGWDFILRTYHPGTGILKLEEKYAWQSLMGSEEWDAAGRPVRRMWSDAQGTRSESWHYDGQGRVDRHETTLHNGHTIEAEIVETQYPADGSEPIRTERHESRNLSNQVMAYTQTTFHPDGSKTVVGLEAANVLAGVPQATTISVYDAAGRSTRSEYHSSISNSVTDREYDGNGRLIHSRSVSSGPAYDFESETTNTYDASGVLQMALIDVENSNSDLGIHTHQITVKKPDVFLRVEYVFDENDAIVGTKVFARPQGPGGPWIAQPDLDSNGYQDWQTVLDLYENPPAAAPAWAMESLDRTAERNAAVSSNTSADAGSTFVNELAEANDPNTENFLGL